MVTRTRNAGIRWKREVCTRSFTNFALLGAPFSGRAKHQLKRRDQIVLYATCSGQVGCLMQTSVCTRSLVRWITPVRANIPNTAQYQCLLRHRRNIRFLLGTPRATMVCASIPPFFSASCAPREQLIVVESISPCTEYKTISKRIVVTGNQSYIHLSADTRSGIASQKNQMRGDACVLV